ncbi:MAG: hypothetical protein HRU69_14015 [Flammeovirgaceae bacterium]|nr:MAG: hypothetical protein HRU69_14015 [Flammeovirgaceae bacterium]
MTGQQLLTLFITTTILTIGTLTAFGQDCEKLGDGQYLFKHKTKGHKKSDFRLLITGDRYNIKREGQEELKGDIKWSSDNCMFQLHGDNEVPINIDSLDSVSKLLMKTSSSYGGACYEITDKEKFRLTYCGNLHITMSEGRISKRRR